MKHFLLFLTTYLSFAVNGQNLVLNPSFEELYGRPPHGHSNISCARYWFSAYMMGTDYFNRKIGKGEAVPKNDLGYQEPRTGDAYAGFCLHWKYLEYLQTQLKDTLEEGKKYLIEFYISRAEKSITSVHELGMLFSGQARKTIKESGLVDEPSIKFKSGHGFRNKDEWMKLTGVYEAQGYETHMILGYFPYEKSKNFSGFVHYFVDDVSITLLEEGAEVEIPEPMDEPLVEEEIQEEILEETPNVFAPKTGETIRLNNVFFASNQSELLPQSYTELDKLAAYLLENSNVKIRISGHTDNTGDEKRNLQLSEERAKAVADYLNLREIDLKRIEFHGYGSTKPIASNTSDDGKRQNRRVEFILVSNN